ncbi:VWA domain-containing protein [Streptomyces sp. AJS327]|uniref:VWA domain-containing protein n=1 Tax=Streptomyces sp. AJS327 TaxID=2545265 RepID=UPI002155A28D|nr:VWA domain-containing protein [Streptomyces sp. AJS327]
MAQLLEESRAESAHLARRPHDRRWLRACVARLVMPDMPTYRPEAPPAAAWVAGLILARRDAGILDADEVRVLEARITEVLGAEVLSKLRLIWRAAQATADTDAEAMMEHARAWREVLAALRQQPESRANSFTRTAAECVRRVAGGEAQEAASEVEAATASQSARKSRVEERERKVAARASAAHQARRVFAPGTPQPIPHSKSDSPQVRNPVAGTRPPTAGEKVAAGRLGRALRVAAHRERVSTRVPTTTPPGRLSMRGALARDAQRSAGQIPTAAPWHRTRYQRAPNPSLRFGVALDVSGSMKDACGPIASAAWILAKAVAVTGRDSTFAAVTFDKCITAITAPGRTPSQVTELEAVGGGHCLGGAINVLDAALGLTSAGTGGRLLAIASDGRFTPEQWAEANSCLGALRNSGCALLWLTFAPDPHDVLRRAAPDVPRIELGAPAQAVDVLAKAATSALHSA